MLLLWNHLKFFSVKLSVNITCAKMRLWQKCDSNWLWFPRLWVCCGRNSKHQRRDVQRWAKRTDECEHSTRKHSFFFYFFRILKIAFLSDMYRTLFSVMRSLICCKYIHTEGPCIVPNLGRKEKRLHYFRQKLAGYSMQQFTAQ